MTATTISERTTGTGAVTRSISGVWDRLNILARAMGTAARRGIAGAQLGSIDEVEIGRKTGARC